MAEVLTTLVLSAHIASGALAMVAGLIALCAGKGGRAHRTAGKGFVAAMLVTAVSAAILGVVRPGQIINVFIAAFSLYLVLTAWLTARRRDAPAGVPERIALACSIVLIAPFAAVIFQIVTGVKVFESAFVIEGAILVALCVFATIMGIAVVGDLRLVMGFGRSQTSRLTRHLWRMCFASALTLGSAFTNGFARLLPGPYHVPPAFFAPQLLMLVVMLYWIVRVRLRGRPDRNAAPAAG